MNQLALFVFTILFFSQYLGVVKAWQDEKQVRPRRVKDQSQQEAKQPKERGDSIFQEASDTVAKDVSDSETQRFVTCNLQAAIWGEYDVKIEVDASKTSDGRSLMFLISNGKFSKVTIPYAVDREATAERSNRVVSIGSQKEAFKKGLPFYVAEVSFETPTLLHYTVVSNPEISINDAHARVWLFIVKVDDGQPYNVYSQYFDTQPLSSSAQPQNRTWKLGKPIELGSSTQPYFSIITFSNRPGYVNSCLVSNEVLLARPK